MSIKPGDYRRSISSKQGIVAMVPSLGSIVVLQTLLVV